MFVLVKLEFRQKIKFQTSLIQLANDMENCLVRGGDFFPKGGCPKGGREGGKPLIPRGKAQKKA